MYLWIVWSQRLLITRLDDGCSITKLIHEEVGATKAIHRCLRLLSVEIRSAHGGSSKATVQLQLLSRLASDIMKGFISKNCTHLAGIQAPDHRLDQALDASCRMSSSYHLNLCASLHNSRLVSAAVHL